MTVYIDPPTWPGHGRLWSHLISDESYAAGLLLGLRAAPTARGVIVGLDKLLDLPLSSNKS